MNRIVLAFSLTCLAFGARAADHASCAAAIRDAVASDGKSSVPDSCWAIGPVAMGQTRKDVEKVLGPPDTNYFVTDTAGAWPGMEEYRYVFPRDLRLALKNHPVERSAFKPVTLTVHFVDGHVAALSLATIYWSGDSKCASRWPSPAEAAMDTSFPFTFNGVAPDAPLARFVATFGRWSRQFSAMESDGLRRRDVVDLDYKPLGLAVSTMDKKHPRIVGLSFSPAYKDFAITGVSAPYFKLMRDPETCRVTGFATQ